MIKKSKAVTSVNFKWGLMTTFTLLSVWSFGGSEHLASRHSTIVQSSTNAPVKFSSRPLHSDFWQHHGDLEYLERTEDDNDDHTHSHQIATELENLPAYKEDCLNTQYFSCKSDVKLFVLYHSWKAHLFF